MGLYYTGLLNAVERSVHLHGSGDISGLVSLLIEWEMQ